MGGNTYLKGQEIGGHLDDQKKKEKKQKILIKFKKRFINIQDKQVQAPEKKTILMGKWSMSRVSGKEPNVGRPWSETVLGF